MTPAQPSMVTMGVQSVICTSMDLQFMMSTDATQLSTTTDDLTQLSIWIVFLLLATWRSDLEHATRQMAVFALPSVTCVCLGVTGVYVR